MIGPILQFRDLQELCKPGEEPRVSTVERWARKIGLRYTYDAQGGMISTIDAVQEVLGTRAANDGGSLDPDEVF